ncbi:pulmonary surfactant-associated protein D-like [Sycon ciliatum]|uniref:pulmonary surfactant-associated protein D-like n=1 Tax=Sycon ciliatum TaxID=27933 RepID=UPI0031F67A9F
MTLADDITADKRKRYAEEYLTSMDEEEIDQARQLAEERRAAGDYTTAKRVNSTSSAVGKREARTASMTVQCCRNSRTGLLIYRYENRPMTRGEARRNCRRNGGDLASPSNMQEFIVLENLIRPFTGVPGVWLFYNDVKTEGRFVDVSGRPAVINNFLKGEPNNVGPGGEDCVEMDGGTGMFNDTPCSQERLSVCQFRIL